MLRRLAINRPIEMNAADRSSAQEFKADLPARYEIDGFSSHFYSQNRRFSFFFVRQNSPGLAVD